MNSISVSLSLSLSHLPGRMLAASSASQREHDNEELRRQEREFFQKLSKPIEELDGLAFLVETHKKNKLLEEDSQANTEIEQMDELDSPPTGQDVVDGDKDDHGDHDLQLPLDTPRKATPPKGKVHSPKRKQKEHEQDEPGHPNSSNEQVTKSTPRNGKRRRSK